jgi:hypothetical protein
MNPPASNAASPTLLDSNLHSPERRLIELRMEHADLDALIDRAGETSPRSMNFAAPPEEAPPRAARPDHARSNIARPQRTRVTESCRGPCARPSRPTARCRRAGDAFREPRARPRWPSPSRAPSPRAARWSSKPAPASARLFPTSCPPAERRTRAAVDRHQDLARPAVRPRPAAAGRSAGPAGAHALLKGRGSYLCLHRLELARQDAYRCPIVSAAHAGQDRRMVQGHAHRRPGRTAGAGRALAGDSAGHLHARKLPGLAHARKFRACHVNLARREALAADVVVINHHLFFADLAVRESGMAELLPTVRVAIFDEAHQLNETGVQFLGTNWAPASCWTLRATCWRAGLQFARGLVDWQQGGRGAGARRARPAAGGRPRPGTKLRWTGECARRHRSRCLGRVSWTTVQQPRVLRRPRRAGHGQRNRARLRAPARARRQARRTRPALRSMPATRDRCAGSTWAAPAADRIAARHRRGRAQAAAEGAGAPSRRWEGARKKPGSSLRPRWATIRACAGSPSLAAWRRPRCCGWQPVRLRLAGGAVRAACDLPKAQRPRPQLAVAESAAGGPAGWAAAPWC